MMSMRLLTGLKKACLLVGLILVLLSNDQVQVDGLTIEWAGQRVLVNPPYSNPAPWIDRVIMECKKGKTVALLVKHDSSTR
jgi:hypothetical protein